MLGSQLPADVYSRYLKLKGEECIYICGNDEHGTAIAIEAERQGVSPKELAEKYHKIHKKITEDFNFNLDAFSRTSNPQNVKTTQEIYEKIKSNGYIYRKMVKQLYCDKCGRFLPDRFVSGKCPFCGYEEARGDQCEKCGKLLEPIQLIEPRCASCQSTPIEKDSEHIFFKLSELSGKLGEWIEKSTYWPANARNFALSWIKSGLEDRDISREIEWGVPIPDLPGNVFYSWFDAPIGYISFAEEIGKGGWWKDKDTRVVHFLGKDNIAFHTIFFPGMLIAAGGYVLPYHIASYEFLNYDGRKFSKSRGIGIFCREATELYPADYWRYYLISILTEHRDADFTWETFQEKINNDLNDVLGNFVHRTLTLDQKFFAGKVPKPDNYTLHDEKVEDEIEKRAKETGELLAAIKLKDALASVIELARAGNQYLTAEEPWKNPQRRANVIYLCLNIISSLSVLLGPFVPESAQKMRKFLSLDENYKWDDALKSLEPGKQLGGFEPMFKKIEEKEIKELKKRFG